MTKREAFIKIVENEIFSNEKNEIYKDAYEDYNLAKDFFEEFKSDKTKDKPIITENGIKILQFMQENKDKYNNIFKAKEIAEGLFISSHSVSGSMRKLITEGFVQKIGQDPVAYAITDKGKDKDLSNI